MSANNYILINKKTFAIKDCDIESTDGLLVEQGKTLEEAIEIAEKYMKENIVEYGIHFQKK